MKKWLTNIATMLFTTLIMLLICELVIWIFLPQKLAPVKFQFDKDIGLMHIPHLEGSESMPENYDIDFSNGEDGFRNVSKEKLPSHINKKIMLIGDSFTYGKGVNDEETFAYLLQSRVLKDSAQIINAGVEGRGTDHALLSYQIYKDKYQPNTVIYFAHYNDLADNIRDEYYTIVNDSTFTPKSFEELTGGTKKKLQNSKVYNWLVSNSHFFALLKTVLVAVWMPDQIVTYDSEFDMNRAKKITADFMTQLRKEVEADGRRLKVYYIPSVQDWEARATGELTEQERFFNDYFENNIDFHNLSDDFIDSSEPEIVKHFYLPEGHWNPKGHQLASEKLKIDANGFY